MFVLLLDETFEIWIPVFWFLCISAIILCNLTIYSFWSLFDLPWPTDFFFISSNYILLCLACRTYSIPSFITLSSFPITFSCFLIVYLYMLIRSLSFLNFSIFYSRAWMLFFWFRITELSCIVFDTWGYITWIDFSSSLFFTLSDLYNWDIFIIFSRSYFWFILSTYLCTKFTSSSYSCKAFLLNIEFSFWSSFTRLLKSLISEAASRSDSDLSSNYRSILAII